MPSSTPRVGIVSATQTQFRAVLGPLAARRPDRQRGDRLPQGCRRLDDGRRLRHRLRQRRPRRPQHLQLRLPRRDGRAPQGGVARRGGRPVGARSTRATKIARRRGRRSVSSSPTPSRRSPTLAPSTGPSASPSTSGRSGFDQRAAAGLQAQRYLAAHGLDAEDRSAGRSPHDWANAAANPWRRRRRGARRRRRSRLGDCVAAPLRELEISRGRSTARSPIADRHRARSPDGSLRRPVWITGHGHGDGPARFTGRERRRELAACRGRRQHGVPARRHRRPRGRSPGRGRRAGSAAERADGARGARPRRAGAGPPTLYGDGAPVARQPLGRRRCPPTRSWPPGWCGCSEAARSSAGRAAHAPDGRPRARPRRRRRRHAEPLRLHPGGLNA